MTDTSTTIGRIPGGVDGQRMRRLRVEAGLTAATLADRVSASLQHICDIERGRRRPSPPLLLRIADALEVRTAELLHPEPRHVHG